MSEATNTKQTLSYEACVRLWESLPRTLRRVPPRVRFVIRPNDAVPPGQAYRLDLRDVWAPGDIDVAYVMHPEDLEALRTRGFTDDDVSVAFEELAAAQPPK